MTIQSIYHTTLPMGPYFGMQLSVRLSLSVRETDSEIFHLWVVLWSGFRRGPSFMSVPNLKRIAPFVQKLLGDVRRKANEFANFHTPRVFNAPADGVPLGILYRRRGLRKLE